jgi:hypothetical protein
MSRLSRVEFSKQFERHFKIHLRPEWIDGLMTALHPGLAICFDVVKFDQHLHQQFGEYEEQGRSMAAIIEENFGTPARKLIEDHL